MDFTTSHVFYLLFLALYSAVFAGIATKDRALVGTRWFACSIVLEFCKVFLQSLGDHASRLLTILLANEINILDFVFLYLGFRWFVRRTPLQARTGMVLVGGAMLLYAGMFLTHVRYAFIVMGLPVWVLCGASVTKLLEEKKERFRLPARITAGLLVVHLCLLSYRMVLSIAAYRNGRSFHTSWNDHRWMYSMLALMMIGACLMLSYLWFTAAEMYSRLADDAKLDALTGVLNRGSLLQMAERAIESRHVTGEPLALIVMDLDHFKQVNDTFGHGGGDAVLLGVVHCLRQRLGPGTSLACLGGEEFVVLLPGMALRAATTLAEELRKAVGALGVPYDGENICITMSSGLTEITNDDDDWATAMKRADQALYEAKKSGRNRVVATPRKAAKPFMVGVGRDTEGAVTLLKDVNGHV